MREVLVGFVLILSLFFIIIPAHAEASDDKTNWVFIEAEDYPKTNFPGFVTSERGKYLEGASGNEYLSLSTSNRNPHLGYWFTENWFNVPGDGEYIKIWIAVSPDMGQWINSLEWTLDGQHFIQGGILRSLPEEYSSLNFTWFKLDRKDLDIYLKAEDNPHSIKFRFSSRAADSFKIKIDAIMLINETHLKPNGTEKPDTDRGYLNSYQDFAVYSRNWMDRIMPETIPEHDEITNEISTFASPGEYEPATFSVYALKPLEDVQIQLTDLQNEKGNVISKNNIDLRTVGVVEKRVRYKSDPSETEMVPEILNHYQVIDIPENTSYQYYMITKIPDNAEPGNYTGEITINPSNTNQKPLTFNVEVLGIKLLEKPDNVHGFYYTKKKDKIGQIGGEPARFHDYVRNDFLDMGEHGVRGITYNFEEVSISQMPDGSVEVNYSDYRKGLEIMKEAGFDGTIVHVAVKEDKYNAFLNYSGSEQEANEAYKEMIQNLMDTGEEYGLEVVFAVTDEPYSHTERFETFFLLAGLIKQVPGARVYCTIPAWANLSLSESDFSLPESPGKPSVDDLLDIRSYGAISVDSGTISGTTPYEELRNDITSSGDEAWNYYNIVVPGGRPEFSRVTNGFWFFISPFSASYPYTFQRWYGDIFNDTDGGQSDWAYGYPDTQNDLAPTLYSLKYEGYREGYDDIRYVYTLQRTKDEVKAMGINFDNAKKLLNGLKDKLKEIGPDAYGITGYFDGEDYDDWRYKIAKEIVNLKEAVIDAIDIYIDGVIDVQDLVAIASDFGETEGFNSRADTDNSGEIDIYDMVFIASRFT